MPRLFTGLEVPAEVGMLLAGFRGGLPGARWVEPENYHVTLRFIGDVDGGTARDIDALLQEARRRGPLDVMLDALGSFGGQRPHAVFARVAPRPGLAELQAEHERLMRRAGLEPERRKFHPHVTLARLRRTTPFDVAGYLAMQGGFPALRFTAHRCALFSARDSISGEPYVVEAAYPLE